MLSKIVKIKKGDNVRIKSGKDKGKQGKVSQVFPQESKLVVEGMNIAKRHLRGKKRGEPGQVVEYSAPMAIAKVQLVCTKCGKVTRVGYIHNDEKEKLRICIKCKATI